MCLLISFELLGSPEFPFFCCVYSKIVRSFEVVWALKNRYIERIILSSYMGIKIHNEIRIPFWTTRIKWKVRSFFCVAFGWCFLCCVFFLFAHIHICICLYIFIYIHTYIHSIHPYTHACPYITARVAPFPWVSSSLSVVAVVQNSATWVQKRDMCFRHMEQRPKNTLVICCIYAHLNGCIYICIYLFFYIYIFIYIRIYYIYTWDSTTLFFWGVLTSH